MVVDENFVLTRLDPAGKHHAKRAGFDWNVGDKVTSEALDKVADKMADTLISALVDRPMAHDVEHLYLTDPIRDFGELGGMMFSGGVAEYVYAREERDFGDLGKRIGSALRRKVEAGRLPWEFLPARECIRATALGASEYSVQLSGNTSFISNPGTLLPRRNLQVIQPPFEFGDDIDHEALGRAIIAHRKAFEVEGAAIDIALAFHWSGVPAYERIFNTARGIAIGLADHIEAKKPLYIMLDGDIAQTLGAVLREDCGVKSEILVIDGVMLMDFDYIDLGKVRIPSYTVPVTIKSLVFSEDPRGPRAKERIHHVEADQEHGHWHHHHEHGHDHHHTHAHDHHHDHGHTHGKS
jgi:ethanolamine utilization protein EutA